MIYRCKNTEQLGILVEKAMCNIVNIPFNTKRKYDDLPDEITDDISCTVGPILKKMKLRHVGNMNQKYDFINEQDNKTVSVKTLMKGNRICPQNIGQCSLSSISSKLDIQFGSNNMFKSYFMTNKMKMLQKYLENCFCCDTTLVYKFDKGLVYIIKRDMKNDISFSKDFELSTSKLLQDWNESNTIYINDVDKKMSLGELQIHNNRDCVKFRFNVDTLIQMINDGYINNLKVDIYNLKSKYKFKVIQEKKNSLKHKGHKGIEDMKKLCFRSFNYIGSKMKLLDFIRGSIGDYTGKSYDKIHSFADICSGTGVVTFDVIKGGCKKVLINDIQHYAYMISSVWTKSDMDLVKMKDIIFKLNTELDLMNEDNLNVNLDDFIYNNYTEKSDRLYLTKLNGYKTDYTRKKIEILKRENIINDKEYRLLLKLLLYGVASVSNIASVYGAFLKKYKKVALKKLYLDWSLVEDLVDKKIEHKSYNSGIVELLDKTDLSDYEVVYMDPPYVANRGYHDNYHLLETISRYDNPKIKGKTGLREVVDTKSRFCSKLDALNEFRNVLCKLNSKYVFISYSSESVVSKDVMIELLKNTGWKDVKCYEKEYKRFKSNKNSEEKQEKVVIEYVFCGTNNKLNK
jgi:adenine-specific DNA-methyltransferase